MYLDKNEKEIVLGDTIIDKRFKGMMFKIVNHSDGKLWAYNGVYLRPLKDKNENYELI